MKFLKNIVHLNILDRYIIRKFLGTFFYAIALIIVIVIIFDISEKVDDFLEKEAPLRAIMFDYYANFIPYFINLFSPLFTFIAVIFFTSKLAGRTEIIAMLSSGISFRRLLRPYLVSATILAVMSFMLANFVIPYTNVNLMNFEYRYIKQPKKSAGVDIHMQVSAGTFIYLENYNNAEDIGYKFTLEKFEKESMIFKLQAEFIQWDTLKNNWKLKHFIIRTLQGKQESLHAGAEMDTVMDFIPNDFKVNIDDAKTMKFMELRRFIDKEKLKGSERVTEFEVEKHKRIAFPFATIVLTLIAVSLSSRKVRGGIGVHLGAGIAIAFSFILFMQISTTFSVYGNLPPFIAVWIPNIIFAFLGIYLLRIAPK